LPWPVRAEIEQLNRKQGLETFLPPYVQLGLLFVSTEAEDERRTARHFGLQQIGELLQALFSETRGCFE
jgi:hypothetical protein